MGGTAGTKVAYFTAGAVAAGLIAGAFIATTADDEERPPIIVKGGSLIFESGDTNGESGEQTGKPWVKVGDDWQPDHPDGIPVTKFTLALRGGNTQLCPALERTKEVTVTYKPNNGTEKTFSITTKPRPGVGGKPAPAIVGSELSTGGTTNNPQVVYDPSGKGEITHVKFRGTGGDVDCPAPTSVKVWQDR